MAWLSRKMAWPDRGLPPIGPQCETKEFCFPYFSSTLHGLDIDLFNKSQKAGRPRHKYTTGQVPMYLPRHGHSIDEVIPIGLSITGMAQQPLQEIALRAP